MRRDLLVYRRRAHLVLVDEHMWLTLPDWPLYWSPSDERTYVVINHVGTERLWLPLCRLVGHWDWFAGTIAGAYVRDGYGPAGMSRPKVARISRTSKRDPDTGACYWYSDARSHIPQLPDPLATT